VLREKKTLPTGSVQRTKQAAEIGALRSQHAAVHQEALSVHCKRHISRRSVVEQLDQVLYERVLYS